MKLNDLLATPDYSAVKLAVETPDNQQVEQDFGRLAYAFLKDRAAQLIDYLVGFEVVEQEPDGSRAVGIFGFRIGSSFFYVPAFFLNNQIKGMDMLYSKDDSTFTPLQESWINHILNRKTIELGEPAQQDVKQDFTVPDYTFLSRPPLGGSTKLSAHMHDFCDVWNTMQAELCSMLDKDAEFAKSLSGAVKYLTKDAQDRVQGSTQLKRYLEQTGGPQAVGALLDAFQDYNFLKAATAFYDYHDLMISDFSQALAPKQAKSKIRVVTKKEVYDGSVAAPSDKKKIISDGFSIEDNRTDEEKSEVYNVDYLTHIANPSVTGRYDLMLSSGATAPVMVVNIPYGTSRKGMTLVIDPESGRYFTAMNKTVYVRDGVKEKADNDVLHTSSRAVDLDSIQVGESYILVDDKGCASLPFKVKHVTSHDGERVRAGVEWCDDITHRDSDSTPGLYRDTAPEAARSSYSLQMYDDSYLIPKDRRGELVRSGNNVVVPSGQWKAFRIEKVNRSYDSDDGAQKETFCPASYCDIVDVLNKMAFHNVKVESRDGGLAYSVWMNDLLDQSNLNKKAAMIRLVTQYAFPVDKAEQILKEASAKIKARRLVKLGQVVMPPPPPQYMGFDQQIGVPVQPAQADYVTGQTMGVPPPVPSGPGSGVNVGGEGEMQQMMGGGGGMPSDAVAMAQQGAMLGQQQVFDHATIGGLSRTYDTSSAIDSYIPEMLDTVDRLGRLLFLFYWKNEDFAERYGDQDLTEMEDHLRATFKSLGDLVLKLKQKTIDAEESTYVAAGA
jgi:hypothetical protein